MRYAQIENDVVVQIDCNPRAGFIEVDDSVCCGMKFDGENFSSPKPAGLPIQEQIEALEAQQSPRLSRCASLGDSYSVAKLQEIEDSIKALREGL